MKMRFVAIIIATMMITGSGSVVADDEIIIDAFSDDLTVSEYTSEDVCEIDARDDNRDGLLFEDYSEEDCDVEEDIDQENCLEEEYDSEEMSEEVQEEDEEEEVEGIVGDDERIIASGTCGEGLIWQCTELGVLTISGHGDMYDYDKADDRAPWEELWDKVADVVVEQGVTSIGDCAFCYLDKLVYAEIPLSMQYIGVDAFESTPLRTVLYEGTKEQWYTIEIENWLNSNVELSAALIKCVDGNVNDPYEKSLSLKPDTEITAFITQPGEMTFFYFIPIETSIYSFESIGNDSTECLVFDEHLNVLTYDDDSGPGDNFKIIETFEAGKKYYFGARFDRNETGSILVKLHKRVPNSCGDNLTWEIDGKGTLIISGKGDMDNYKDYSNMGNLNYNSIPPWGTNYSSVIVGNEVTSIGNFAFSQSTIYSIDLPSSINRIGEFAFFFCDNITSITIPSSVRFIGCNAFSNCKNLEHIGLFPGELTIDYSAFSDCKSISNITIPDGVTNLQFNTFLGCEKLSVVVIPKSMEYIDWSAFQDAPIKTVYYKGSKSQWNDVMISDDGNETLLAATVYCSDDGEHEHYPETVYGKAATCTESGLTDGERCLICNEVIITQNAIPALGHSWRNWMVEKAATTTTEGVEARTCGRCGAKETRTVAKVKPSSSETSSQTDKPTQNKTPTQTAKKAQSMTVKAKSPSLKTSKLAKKKQTVKKAKAFTIKNAQGTVTFKKVGGSKNLTISNTGNITVKKGTKKGTYKIKVEVTAAGNDQYEAGTKTVTVKVKVK